jgi:SAM-dependent methyltransferase
MDNFYRALSSGQVKASGVMNYIQHLYIAQRCAGCEVLDLCCGRGLALPALSRVSPPITSYLGIDISQRNLEEGSVWLKEVFPEGIPFPVTFLNGDVSQLPTSRSFQRIIYTSAIEHMPKQDGLNSLLYSYNALAAKGLFFLSTPLTPKSHALQYKVHVYEWAQQELELALSTTGFSIIEAIGLLPKVEDEIAAGIEDTYGDGAKNWYQRLRALIPHQFLDTIISSCFPQHSKEVLYVCTKR